jgi:hypothetical protein
MPTPSLRRFVAAAACCAIAQVMGCGSESSSEDAIVDGPSGIDPQGPADPATDDPPKTGEPGDGDPVQGPTGPAQVQLIGRFDDSDPAGPTATWPGSRIVTRFHGTAVSVTLKEFAEDWMDGVPSYWDVSIDGGPPKAIAMIPDNEPHVFDLASDLPLGEHEVELYKRSEMQTGMTTFLGFDLHGGGGLPPPPRLPRHIEAMADSYGTGYGVEMLDAPDLDCPGAHHGGKYQNFRKAYPALLGERFNAEVEGTVYSGKGLTRGIWPTDTDGLIDYYNRSNPNPARANNPPLFDLSSWVPDAIILAQGTVDNGISDFRNVYRNFVVNQLRARAPNAHIFLVVPGRVAREKFIATVNSVAQERAAAGDTKVHAVIPGEEQAAEMTGCGFHGAPIYHQRIAKEIGDVMAEKMGW